MKIAVKVILNFVIYGTTYLVFHFFKVFQDYVRASNLNVFSPEFQTGHFRQLTVRSASDQLMLVVGIHPQNLTDVEVAAFKQSLIDFFSTGEGKNANVTSLYYQKMVKKLINRIIKIHFIRKESFAGTTKTTLFRQNICGATLTFTRRSWA